MLKIALPKPRSANSISYASPLHDPLAAALALQPALAEYEEVKVRVETGDTVQTGATVEQDDGHVLNFAGWIDEEQFLEHFIDVLSL